MYSPPIVIKIIKLRRIRWAGSMHGEEKECIYNIVWGSQKEGNY
jgi:hypothetical protein